MLLWIFCILLAIILVSVYVGFRTAMDYIHRPKPTTLDTNLNKFKESSSVDNKIMENGETLKRSVSLEFEDRCVKNPENSVDLLDLCKKHKRILNGDILDPHAKDAPSEYIDDHINPKYKTYLINQTRGLKMIGADVSWFEGELKRIKEVESYVDIKEGFYKTLVNDYHIPENCLSYIITDERMENYSNDQWKKLSRAIKSYLSDFDFDTVKSFLAVVENFDALIDFSKMEKFNLWLKHEVPVSIAKENIEDKISDETIMKVVDLVDNHLYDWEEALEEVVNQNITILKNETLRKRYRDIVEGE